MLLLTGARPGEVVRAEISELHLTRSEPTWLLPAQRTKNGLPHLVPSFPFALQLFAAAFGNRNSGPVFPSDATKDGILGEYTLRQAVARLFENGRLTCPTFSPKDLRTTVKTGMAALRIRREIRDAVQNHKPQGIGDRAYNFHDYADEKREALQRWTDHVEKLVGIRQEESNKVPSPVACFHDLIQLCDQSLEVTGAVRRQVAGPYSGSDRTISTSRTRDPSDRRPISAATAAHGRGQRTKPRSWLAIS